MQVGDKVLLMAPQGQFTPTGLVPRLKQFTLVGLFQVGMYEYDAGLALIHLDDAAKLYEWLDTADNRLGVLGGNYPAGVFDYIIRDKATLERFLDAPDPRTVAAPQQESIDRRWSRLAGLLVD